MKNDSIWSDCIQLYNSWKLRTNYKRYFHKNGPILWCVRHTSLKLVFFFLHIFFLALLLRRIELFCSKSTYLHEKPYKIQKKYVKSIFLVDLYESKHPNIETSAERSSFVYVFQFHHLWVNYDFLMISSTFSFFSYKVLKRALFTPSAWNDVITLIRAYTTHTHLK